MPGKKVNVLVYAGNGATIASVRHATWSLRRLLGANYAVVTVTAEQLLREPWTASCALLVMPGGADVSYGRALDGDGTRRIRQYVAAGGAYLGLCAGGYYGCARCEFEVGRPAMEVVGDRELAFFPGACRGLAFPGFEYHSEAGARAAQLVVDDGALGGSGERLAPGLRAYYNGGGVFVDAEKFKDRGVEIVARYSERLAVESGAEQAAVVYCKVGEGAALLTGPHPEFSGVNLNRAESTAPQDYGKVVDALVADEDHRTRFLKACLTKLGLAVSRETQAVPSLSQLHLSAAQPSQMTELVHGWHEAGIVVKDGERDLIRGENDTFILEEQGPRRWSMGAVADALKEAIPHAAAKGEEADGLVDYNTMPKLLLVHGHSVPEGKETPHFNHHSFFSSLEHFHSQQRESEGSFGRAIMYGEVVTSTNTLLDKNPSWLAQLPTGLTATATTQVAGRGRGSNVWVSPAGSLMFSTVLRHALALSSTAPVVFVQYLAALAIVAGIRGYGKGYDGLPVRLKWPNDVYALDPSRPAGDNAYVKIGGILVNSSYAGGDYTLVCGIGLNVSNAGPTTSLAMLAERAGVAAPSLERLLASVLAQFEGLYTRFCRTGFDRALEQQYYDSWLHGDQIVSLEMEGGARARIKGISRDWGLLVAEELGWEDRATGRRFELQSDSNSFDFFKGLLKRKV